MCGIIVSIGKQNIENALHKINHRGTDSSNIYENENITIGFNRLAINDKTIKGNQPYEYKNLVGVCNGEIYNYRKLKNKFNIKTISDSDTAIILPLFKLLGEDIINHLDGFYSGIIYNKTTLEIFTLRDYIGKKPLFLVSNQNRKYIASELKSMNYYDDFKIIPKGFSVIKNGKINTIKEHDKSILIPKRKIRKTIIDATLKRIPEGEDKFGVFLSGGLDSSIIASIIAKYTKNVIYYTLGNNNDLKFVEILSKKIGIEPLIKKIKLPKQEEIGNLIEKIVYHTESYNPSIISNGLATYLLAREARRDSINVVLSGEGADELFCGYDLKNRFENRLNLIENMHFTECRRLDLASMAHTIEVRCPFLDKNVYSISNNCNKKDLIENNQGKQILRKAFKDELPNDIVLRKKMSFDVGSGIRKMVVNYLTKNGKKEKEALKEIWSNYFPRSLRENYYFHSYPVFDVLIAKRGASHPYSQIQKIENLLLKDFRTVPFHNIFMLNNSDIKGSHLGGTCSDKVLHFKNVLKENGIESRLYSAIINEKECHRMLAVNVHNKQYFIDVGSGWVNPKLIPSFQTTEYSIYGTYFKTEIYDKHIFLYHKVSEDFKLMMKIPLKPKSEDEIYKDIEDRFKNKKIYPFNNSLRFSLLINDCFFFIKGNHLRIYSDKGIIQKTLNKNEMKKLIEKDFNFNLNDFDKWYTPI